jgi:hypothetical protein
MGTQISTRTVAVLADLAMEDDQPRSGQPTVRPCAGQQAIGCLPDPAIQLACPDVSLFGQESLAGAVTLVDCKTLRRQGPALQTQLNPAGEIALDLDPSFDLVPVLADHVAAGAVRGREDLEDPRKRHIQAAQHNDQANSCSARYRRYPLSASTCAGFSSPRRS